MRNIGGIGQGNGPFITYHDGFTKQAESIAQGGWNGFLPGADRVGIDTHPYLCFAAPNNDGLAYQAMKVRCRSLAPLLRALLTRWDSPVRTGPTTSTRLPARSVSRWEPSGVSPVRRPFASHFLELGLNPDAVNDCGKWINNVGNGQRFDGTYYIPGQPQAPAFEAVGNCDVWNVRCLPPTS